MGMFFQKTTGPSIYTLEFYAELFWMWSTNTCEYLRRLCGHRTRRAPHGSPRRIRPTADNVPAIRRRGYFSIWRSFK